jgi:chemotaxis protein methyltransferase CheR
MTGISLADYEMNRMRRRIDAYVKGNDYSNVYAFCRHIEKDRDALNQLCDFITNNQSEFFKDFWAFEELRVRVLPLLLRRNHHLKVWNAGCSKGCESYSLAMILESQLDQHSYSITATDINEPNLKLAKAGGPYTSVDMKGCPEPLRRKYLVETDRNAYVTGNLRNHVCFRKHDLLHDEYEKGYDLIVCRNVASLFTENVKGLLFRRLFESVSENGVLFVGATEFITGLAQLGLTKIGSCLYQKILPGPTQFEASQLPVDSFSSLTRRTV